VREEWSRAWCGAMGKQRGEDLGLCFSAKPAPGDKVSGTGATQKNCGDGLGRNRGRQWLQPGALAWCAGGENWSGRPHGGMACFIFNYFPNEFNFKLEILTFLMPKNIETWHGGTSIQME
jgi:hypothetical protein